jgi:hypothetical protein
MRKLWPILIAALCCFSELPARAEAPHDCRLKQAASIDLAGGANGPLLIPVTVKGTAAFMILSTGNAFSTVTRGAAERLGFHVHSTSGYVKSGKNAIDELATSNQFAIGQRLAFKSADFLVVPDDSYASDASGPQPVIGVLGSNLLAQLDIELDSAKRKMNLYLQDHCPGKAVYWSARYDSTPIQVDSLGVMYFPMELGDRKIETVLSTGDPSTTLFVDVAKQLYGIDYQSAGVSSRTDAAAQATFHYRALNLTSENLTIKNADIRLLDKPFPNCEVTERAGVAGYDGCLGIHPLHLGRDALSKLHIYLATKEGMLYFTPADAGQ